MKYCASCRTSYPLDYTACPKDQTPLQLLTEMMPGLVLRGKYEILEKLGAGGMGSVYKARHLAFDELRAIKFVGTHLLADERALARFKAEAVVARRLQHPNAVKVEDLDTSEDGRPFIVMEYVEGRSLRNVFAGDADISVRRVLSLAGQACAALSAAHALGIVHRDIKPDNLMVLAGADGNEILKVADFGLAKVLDGFELATDQAFTQTGFMVGTPLYMSPEQASGLELDGRSDLYSLGVVLYEMFTGRLPFSSDTPFGMMAHHRETPPQSPADLGVPQPLAAFLLKALAKKPDDRFRTAEEMGEAVRLLSLMPLPQFIGQGIREGFDPGWAGSRHSSRAVTLPGSAPSPHSASSRGSGGAREPRTAQSPGRDPRASTVRTNLTPAQPAPTRFVTRPVDDAVPESSAWKIWVGLAAFGLVGAWFVMSREKPATVAPATPTSAEALVSSAQTEAPRSLPAAEAERSDTEIRFDIDRLFQSSTALSGARIRAESLNGIVTLVGEAPNQTSVDLAMSLASSVPGVRQVFSSVELKTASAQTTAANPPGSVPAASAPEPPAAQSEPPRPGPLPTEDPTREKVRALLDSARTKMDARNPEAAELDFRAVLQLEPDNTVAKDMLERLKNRPPPPPGPRPTVQDPG